MTEVLLTSGTIWTVPSNCTSATVECIGGGQGGGASAGGNGGDYAKVNSVALTPGATIAIAIGAGGAGVTSGSQNAGGDTRFGTTVLAKGGGSASTDIGDTVFAGGAGDASGAGGAAAGASGAGASASGTTPGAGDGDLAGGGGAPAPAASITLSASFPSNLHVGDTISFDVTATLANGATAPSAITASSLPAGLAIGAISEVDATHYKATCSGTLTTAQDVTASFGTTGGNVAATPLTHEFVVQAAQAAVALTTSPTSSVSDTTARVSFRTEAAANVAVKYGTASDLSGATTTSAVAVDSTTDYTGQVDLSGLPADTQHYYTLLVNGVDQLSAPYPTFKTFPAAGTPAKFSFAFGSCTDHVNGNDSIFSAVPSDVAFLLHIGDTIYADGDTGGGNGASYAPTTVDGYRSLHRTALAGQDATDANWKTLRAETPVFTMWDDHELYNDFCGGASDTHFAPAKQAFQEYHGRANPDSLTAGELYYTFQVGNVGFFVCDLRSHRSANTLADTSAKTILGDTQKTALKNWLLSNNGAFKLKFIVASVPAHGYAYNTAGDSWGGVDDGVQTPNGANGFRTERNEIWDFIDANAITGVLFHSGDQHWAGSFKTTYASRPRYEFMSSPYNKPNLTPVTRAADPVNGPVFWKYGAGDNVGVVTIDTTVTPATISFQLYGASGSLGSSYLTNITQDDIDTGLQPVTPAITLAATFPSNLHVGDTGSFNVTATLENGATGTLTITASGLPAGMTLGSTTNNGDGTFTAIANYNLTTAQDVTATFGATGGSVAATPLTHEFNVQAVVAGGITPIGAVEFHNPTSITLPSGCQAGDFVLIGHHGTTADVDTTPAGTITSLSLQRWDGSGAASKTAQYGYFLTAADITNGTIAFAATHAYGVASVYRGVSTSNPFNVLPTLPTSVAPSGDPVSVPAASINTTAANCMLVFTALVDGKSSVPPPTFTAPSGFTTAQATLDTGQYFIALAHAPQAAAGASASPAGSYAQGQGAYYVSGFLVALNPA